ncbi:MAG: diguanylate cyclase [Ruminococcus sp.]|nr:diguanylate cyclase [Ruminococcus sp.]
MTRDEIQAQSLEKIKRLSVWMIVGYAVIVVAAILGITSFTVSRYDNVLKDKVSDMTSALNVQLKLNLDSYLNRMETTGTLAFSVDNAYTYDATDPNNDEYEAINTEKQISDDLMSLCLMENFVDYGIVYSNNHTVGKVSNGTTQLFGDNLYTDLSGMITRERTHDGWYTGYGDDYERIYYVKRIHDNALFLISFYTSELESVFDNPENLSDMSVRLTDSGYHMIYSSAKDDTLGSAMPDDIMKNIKDKETAVAIDDVNLTTVNQSNGDWYVICSIPTKIILKEADQMRLIIYLAALVAAIIAVAAGAFFIRKIADPVQTITSSISSELREDGFEGILSNRFFRDKCTSIVPKTASDNCRGLVLVDIDSFTDIINKIGREEADRQLEKMLIVLKEAFPDADAIGRMGENGFNVMTKAAQLDVDTFQIELDRACNEVLNKFKEVADTNTMGTIELTASIGAAIYPDAGKSYQEMFDTAYTALAASKNAGKGKYTIA